MQIAEIIKDASQRLERQDAAGALLQIYEGLLLAPDHYELYFMLGQAMEMQGELIPAKLSYENALFFSSEEDYAYLWENYQAFMEGYQIERRGISIILVTHNQLDFTKLCIESIRYNVPAFDREIIVVDNLSTDDTREWLQEQEDIRVILNEDNKGFPAACNQGAALAREGNDIFLLNNDTIVPRNSVYNLRMALYENSTVGMTGACSNYVGNDQMIRERFDTPEEYLEYAGRNNIFSPAKHKKRLCLAGFAMVIRRKVWDQVGGMDEMYGLGHYEDDDLSLKILLNQYQLLFCEDAFIFHFGHRSFRKMAQKERQQYDALLETNCRLFEQKWGIRWGYFSHIRFPLIEYIDRNPQDCFSFLDIGCGSGATLLEISNRFPEAELYGMELDGHVADIASHYLHVVQGNIEDLQNPFGREFDYIMLGDVLEHLHDPEGILQVLKSWLREDGCFIISLPNIMHISVLYDLLHGDFTYQDEGILDRTHLHFFTKNEILRMLNRCGLLLERMGGSVLPAETPKRKREEFYIRRLFEMDNTIPKDEMAIYQYWVRVRKGRQNTEVSE